MTTSVIPDYVLHLRAECSASQGYATVVDGHTIDNGYEQSCSVTATLTLGDEVRLELFATSGEIPTLDELEWFRKATLGIGAHASALWEQDVENDVAELERDMREHPLDYVDDPATLEDEIAAAIRDSVCEKAEEVLGIALFWE